MHRVNPEENLFLGAGKSTLCIIIVDGVPECIFHELANFRGGTKGKLTRIVVPIYIFIQKVRYNNPNKNYI